MQMNKTKNNERRDRERVEQGIGRGKRGTGPETAKKKEKNRQPRKTEQVRARESVKKSN